MDKDLRNSLRNVVTKCRKLLEEAIGELLHGKFGIHADGKVEDASRLTHLSLDDLRYRDEVLTHLQHIKASGLQSNDATDQLIREAAFTQLNRLCAYKMMTSRGLIDDPLGKGLKSRGFMFYLGDHPADEALFRSAKEDVAYRHYFQSLNEELSADIGVLFAKEDLATRLFPPHRVLVKILDLINTKELANVWSEDETIGWVYQYFTPKELREKSRKEHPSPQNSYELAFRNQFYTPRYVVEFLVDNTLGRLWYEMRKGETLLKRQCRYLVRRPAEKFLLPGEEAPNKEAEASIDLSQEDLLKQLVYVRHREKKDPRDLRILDPACGSGHFLLYCFGLLEVVYEEAYHDADLGPTLKRDYPTLVDLKRDTPRLILEHNLHGIDIDLRSTQISALALWLRSQRAYAELGVEKEARPQIRRTNTVCAESMPGERELLEEFVKEVYPPFLRDVVRVVFDKMKLAGEAGSLLKIEEEISQTVAEAKKQWRETPQHQQLALFGKEKLSDGKQAALFDLSGITDEQFWDEAESRVVEALREYAQRASNGRGVLRQLFADDATQGFAFVDICRKRFDVVLMNPPFGEPAEASREYLRTTYSNQTEDLYCRFGQRGLQFAPGGHVGIISSDSFIKYTDYALYREYIMSRSLVPMLIDLGWEVLDEAYVSASMYLFDDLRGTERTLFIDCKDALDKDAKTESVIRSIAAGSDDPALYIHRLERFRVLDGMPFCFWAPEAFFEMVERSDKTSGLLEEHGIGAGPHNFFFRLYWEVPPVLRGFGKRWVGLVNGGSFSPFYRDDYLCIDWQNNGSDIKRHLNRVYPYLKGNIGLKIQREHLYGRLGITYGKRSSRFNAQILPAGMIPSFEGIGMYPRSAQDIWWLLAYLNTRFVAYFLNLTCGLHKNPVYINRVPLPSLSNTVRQKLAENAKALHKIVRSANSGEETSLTFTAPWICVYRSSSINEAFLLWREDDRKDEVACWKLVNEIESEVTESVGFPLEFEQSLAEDQGPLITRFPLSEDFDKVSFDEIPLSWKGVGRPIINRYDDQPSTDLFLSAMALELHPRSVSTLLHQRKLTNEAERIRFTSALVSWSVGCAFGRWDVRFGTGERTTPEQPEAFAPLPACAPGALIGSDKLPLHQSPPGYPLRVEWSGIVVDDQEHEDDIIGRLRGVLELLWPGRADDIEREACELLDVRELRDYFRKLATGGFWTDHIKRYSKYRRKAPIYWLLRSSKGNYAIWLYYHRLDKDILYKALLNYVEPKLRLEENNLSQLRQRRETVGTTGREAKQLEKDLDKQESFISELHDFHDKLKRAADLHLEPDLNDGVVLNIAPLWELVPWTEAKKYWKELTEGKYEWSTISKQLRERGLLNE